MKRILKLFLSANRVSITFYTTLLIVILFLIRIPILELIELKTYDLRLLSRGKLKPSPSVVMAVIDETSLDTQGRWPWPRAKIANLVDILSQDGAKVIGFDISFVEPEDNPSLELMNQFEGRINALNIKDKTLADIINKAKIGADNDSVFENAIKNSTATIVLGYFFHMNESDLDHQIDQAEINRQLELIDASKYYLSIYEDENMESKPFVKAYVPESNLEILSKATESSGHFNMFPDKDGELRWMPLIIQCGEDIFPSLSIQCVWNYLDRPQLMVRVARHGVEGIQIGNRFIPTDENGKMLINYLGPPKTFPHISIADILQKKLPKGTFEDKIVLVGVTATGIYDLRSTPFSTVYPGLEAHATVIDNILEQNILKKPAWTRVFDLLSIIALTILAGVFIPRLSAIKGSFFTFGVFIFFLIIVFWLFVNFGIWINIVYPLLGLTITFVVLTIYHYMTEERERRKIKGAFSYYVSKSVVNEMLKHPDRLKLGGEKKDLSVLFSDIRGFTTISESISPEDLVHLLNEYLTEMTNIVFKYDGTLDKYMGDAIMAFYGAPLEQEDHPIRACHSALEMMEALEKLNEKWISEKRTPLDIGIGVNTGAMMVGNMGSDQRFDYTVMGDAVNLGSRLEGANKNYRTNILISEYTYERIKDKFVCLEADSVRVKGKTLPVKIYQLLSYKKVSESRNQAISYFSEGIQYYKQQNWNKAIKTFETAKGLDKELHITELYIQRCLDLKMSPPPLDWDGVFTMTTK